MNDFEVRNRSYRVHDQLADRLGLERYQFGYRPADVGLTVLVKLTDGTNATLCSTANAGFEGITAVFATMLGRIHRSLGEVQSFSVVER